MGNSEVKKEFEELKRLNCPCTIIAFDYIETYQKSMGDKFI